MARKASLMAQDDEENDSKQPPVLVDPVRKRNEEVRPLVCAHAWLLLVSATGALPDSKQAAEDAGHAMQVPSAIGGADAKPERTLATAGTMRLLHEMYKAMNAPLAWLALTCILASQGVVFYWQVVRCCWQKLWQKMCSSPCILMAGQRAGLSLQRWSQTERLRYCGCRPSRTG